MSLNFCQITQHSVSKENSSQTCVCISAVHNPFIKWKVFLFVFPVHSFLKYFIPVWCINKLGFHMGCYKQKYYVSICGEVYNEWLDEALLFLYDAVIFEAANFNCMHNNCYPLVMFWWNFLLNYDNNQNRSWLLPSMYSKLAALWKVNPLCQVKPLV
jgi:hypothetical protein